MTTISVALAPPDLRISTRLLPREGLIGGVVALASFGKV